MVTTYPASIDNTVTLPLVSDSVTQISASSLNVLRGAIVAVESQLGVLPAGIYGTVRARLDAMTQMIENMGGGGGGGSGVAFFGDLSGSDTAQTVTGIHNIQINNIAPILGQTLIYDGSRLTYGTSFGNQNVTTTGGIIGGPSILGSLSTQLFDLTGKAIFNAITSVNVSDPGQAIIYYDQTTNKLLVSENGGAYVDLVGGGDTVRNITSSYAVIPTDNVISVNAISGPIIITLESSPLISRSVAVKDANGLASTYNITINGNGHNIDGASNSIITQAYGSIDLIFNGSKWVSI